MALQQVTRSVPIVFVGVTDPVGLLVVGAIVVLGTPRPTFEWR
jgi:ABC-type uncharacterized transport system substrate-binding protein